MELVHEEEEQNKKTDKLTVTKAVENTKVEELFTTQPNPRWTISALTYGGACASHGNRDVRNDLVESAMLEGKFIIIPTLGH